MRALFLTLTAFNLACLLLTALLGYRFGGSTVTQWHPLAGITATIACVGVHCVVFTYFIATAKWIQHAVTVKHLDPLLIAPTRSFKLQAFPTALLAMTATFAAAVSGVITVNYGVDPTTHHVLAWLALAINTAAVLPEYRAITRNGELIDRILAEIQAT